MPADVIVIGSGPNGLAAAIALARAGRSVRVVEGAEQIGGGARSLPLTLPGFLHDVCSAVYPLAVASPFFQTLQLERHGLEWIHPPVPLAHPLDDGTAVVLDRSVARTAAALGEDGSAYERLMAPLAAAWPGLAADVLGPPLRVPAHPVALARFGRRAILSAARLARRFARVPAAALVAGLAAHGVRPLHRPLTSAIALVLAASGHAGGWPIPRGGARRITDALVACLRSHGGDLEIGRWVRSLDEIDAPVVVCDVTPRQLATLAGGRWPPAYRRRLQRFRYGPGIFKIDWALDAPIPWTADACRQAGTVHVGGSFDEIASSEREVWAGRHPARPFVLLSQPSLFDPLRAPEGRHVAWAYCHVPSGAAADMTAAIEAQIERFAPGFQERILMRHVMPPAALEAYNPNLVGGAITGGVADLRQTLFRPTLRPYRTPAPDVFLCSASTPPGGGVHGMCGYHAAQAVLAFGR